MQDEDVTDERAPRSIVFWALPVILVVFIPGLWWTSADAPFPLRPDLVMTMTLFVALITIALLAVLSRGFKSRLRWSMAATTAIIAIAFQWPVFTAIGTQLSEITGVALLGDVATVAFAGALVWLAVRLAEDWYFAVGACIATVAAVAILSATAVSLKPARDGSTASGIAPGPDVLLLVLDGYGRADWLEAEFGMDNSGFLDSLEERGFTIATDATANYATTYASVSAMLNLDYVFDAGELAGNDWDLMRSVLTGRIGLIPTFDAAGYETTYFENAWGGSQCGPSIDRCIRDGLAERSLWNLSQMTIIAPLVREISPDPFNSVSLDHLKSLGSVLAEQGSSGQPRLTVAHVLLPHAPLLLNADCTREPHDELRRWGSDPAKLDARRHNYVEQAGCVDQLVLDAIDQLLTRDPNSIVMITADHGPASTLDFDLPVTELAEATILERMTILSAYRLPGCETSVRPDLTPVNGARIMTDCALGTDLGEIADENFWAISMTDPITSVGPVLDGKATP